MKKNIAVVSIVFALLPAICAAQGIFDGTVENGGEQHRLSGQTFGVCF